jgi:hypothetical protein
VGDKDILGNWNLDNAKKVTTDSYTFENLAAGTYKFRISLDGTWDNTKGYSDLTVKNANLFGADDNNITFTLDKATDVTITYTNEVFQLEGDFAVPAIAVACSANDGSWYNPLAFTVANDKKTASYTFENLAAGDYQFKIVCNGVWLSLPDSEDGLYTFHRGWTGAKDLIINMEPNMKFHADLAGDYTITWVFANDSIYFTYPALPTYAVTIANPANGTISVKNGDDAVASGAELLAGTVLTVAATPASGYEISNLRAFKTGEPETPVAITDGQLSMPAFPITITADAERIVRFTITGNAALMGEGNAWIADKAIKVYENSYTFENLAAGEYQLKVIDNGEWKGYEVLVETSPSVTSDAYGNIVFTLAEPSNVTVTYTDGKIKLQGEFALPKVQISSNWNFETEWSAVDLVPAQDGLTATCTKLLIAGSNHQTSQLKVVVNGDWRSQAVTISSTSTTVANLIADNEEAINLTVEKTGEYTFTWTYATNTLTVTYPTEPAATTTLYFVNEPEWENVKAFVVKGNVVLADWPGEAMTKTGEKVAGKDIYSYTFPSVFQTIIFNNGGAGEGSQTADLAWTASKPYYYDGVWYESVEAIIPGVPAKYYITGDAALVGAGTPWAANAIKVIEDSYTFENLAAGTYQLQINLEGVQDGTWKGYSNLTATADGLYTNEDNNIIFTLAKAGNVTVTYNATAFTLTGNFYVPVLTDGYYLIGQNGWDVSSLSAALLFKASAMVEGEYELNVTLTEGQNLKVVSVVRDVILTWYPDGDGNNYVVDAAHAGEKTVYFRPAGNEAWAEFGGYIYIKKNETTATDQATDGIKAVKTLENGMIIIRLGDKTYNAQGQLIR